jgi:radical SAM superfamily enzyme YgiQ (UPF0313 family)
MALGVFALADALENCGFTARIVHLGLEKNLDSRFTIARYLSKNPCRVVAFSCHFHQQLYDTLRAARSVKAHDPSIYVVMGGMTSSYFAKDILAAYPVVDAVIRGEGELPLRQLVSAVVQGDRDMSKVANLVWRTESGIRKNEETYFASREDLDALDFCNLSLMEHYAKYVEMPKIFTRLALPAKARWKVSRLLSQKWKQRTFFALPVGRGCITNCFYCGGGINAHKLLNSRKCVVFRSKERVIESIRELISYGYGGAYVSFDPLPESDSYYQSLFQRIRTEGLKFDIPFSSWALPSRGFLDEYGKTFSRSAYIAISPETGSESLRKRSRGIFFSNEDLLDTIQYADARGVRTVIFFSLGIPGETKGDFEETLRLRDAIEKRSRSATVDAFLVEVEPASPWHLDPERFGITLMRRGLEDFIRDQASHNYSSMSSLGCYQREYLGEPVMDSEGYGRRVLETKCRYFCRRNRSCQLAGAVWGLTRCMGLNPSGDVKI